MTKPEHRRLNVGMPTFIEEPTPWMEQAVCVQTDGDGFFPDKGGSTREAKRVCLGCEVRAECLEYALAHDERWGVWGGFSERERRRIQRGEKVELQIPHRKGPVPLLRTCVICGGKFQGTNQAKYCSDECRGHSYRSRRTQISCRICGTRFIGDKRSRYCSQACKQQGYRESHRKHRSLSLSRGVA